MKRCLYKHMLFRTFDV